MTNNLIQSMKITGKTKFQISLYNFRISKSGGIAPLQLDCDIDDLPENLLKVTKAPNNDAIRKYIELTSDNPYAHLGERSEILRVS